MTARHLPTLGVALLVLVLVTDLPHKAAAIRTRSLAAANGPRCYKDCYVKCTNCFNVPVYGMPSRDEKAAGCGRETNCPCALVVVDVTPATATRTVPAVLIKSIALLAG